MKRNRLECGHDAARVYDYTDARRWQVRCRVCGHEEGWTQRRWRGTLSPPPNALLRIVDEDDSARVAISA